MVGTSTEKRPGTVPQDESVNRLRKDAREAFVRATDDGSLESAFLGPSGRR
jgi:hypothetical protein